MYFCIPNFTRYKMNITKKDVDALNAVLTVEIEKKDYSEKVDKILKNYQKSANIPGFRKGHVPMGMIKRQYGKAVLVEEVNKIIQDFLRDYLDQEKLDILGYPLPKNENEIDWNSEDFTFEFDLGLTPQFEVDLKAKAHTYYKIVADDEMIEKQITSIRKQLGKLISKTEVEEGDEITGTFKYEASEGSEDSEIESFERTATFSTTEIGDKKQLKTLLSSKVGDVVSLNTKGFFADEHENQKIFGVPHDAAHGLDIDVTLEIKEVNKRELAEMNQEFFDKVFGEGNVSSEAEMKEKIKENAERDFQQQSDQKFLNDVVDSLIADTSFDLPADFLKRWIAVAGEKELSEEAATAEYERSEKGLRYQLIEGKIRTENDLKVTFEELKDTAKNLIKAQMAQFGQMNPSEEELEGVAARVLSNREEVERLTEQLMTNKMLQYFKENAKIETKELSFDEFIKEAYS